MRNPNPAPNTLPIALAITAFEMQASLNANGSIVGSGNLYGVVLLGGGAGWGKGIV